MPRLSTPIRRTAAVFLRSVVDGRETFQREQYNIVSLDYGDGSAIQTYVELAIQCHKSPLERTEVYDEVRFYDSPPFPRTRIGYGAAGQ